MELTSFRFLCFFALLLFLWYFLPVLTGGRGQRMVLLAASLLYYLFAGNGLLILFPLTSALATFWCVRGITKTEKTDTRRRRGFLIFLMVVLLGSLVAFKVMGYFGIRPGGYGAPLGLSFYTFILLGYFLDVYNGIDEGGVDLAGTVLGGMYFPLMTSGPIVRFKDFAGQFSLRHRLQYDALVFGLQRMLWGFFKQLVISQRLGKIVDTVYAAGSGYTGWYIWLGTVCFAFQLYTNFSGCMDIVLGLSEALGLSLPENFRLPFLSRTISEYWRRWHITLGTWMRDMVFYPLLRSRFFMEQGKRLTARFGKKTGKKLNTWGAMFVLWLSVGFWHGGALKYVIGSGLLHWLYIVVGEATQPFFTKLLSERLHLDPKSRFLDALRVIRTFFLVCVGFVFFRADSTGHACLLLFRALPWKTAVPPDGGLFAMGLGWIEWGVLLISLVILIAVELINEKHSDGGGIRNRIAAMPIAIRWLLWFALLFYVVLLGEYGPGYSAAEFIYRGF
ncbi:MAG: MBOAT family protein [Lachnospiraceae bacterium]|nr:MBOAT family protein [Lachnospiraceae bacterium]